jgi:hypothetical protein
MPGLGQASLRASNFSAANWRKGRVRRSAKGPLFDATECDAQHKNAASQTAKPPAPPRLAALPSSPIGAVFLDGSRRAVEPGGEVMRQTSPLSLLLKEGRSSPTREELRPRSGAQAGNLLITRLIGCRDSAIMRCGPPTRTGRIMAKRKKASKAQKRGKLPRRKSAARGKAHKAARAKTVARAKPKRTPVKKAARKVNNQPVALVVETVAAEVIEQPAPAVISVTEVEETEVRKAS